MPILDDILKLLSPGLVPILGAWVIIVFQLKNELKEDARFQAPPGIVWILLSAVFSFALAYQQSLLPPNEQLIEVWWIQGLIGVGAIIVIARGAGKVFESVEEDSKGAPKDPPAEPGA